MKNVTAVCSIAGHVNMYLGRDREELWSAGLPLVRGFRREFGSLECREITGLAFNSVADLSGYIATSEVCSRIIQWCAEECSRLLSGQPSVL